MATTKDQDSIKEGKKKKSKERETEDQKTSLKRPQTRGKSEEVKDGDVNDEKHEVVKEEESKNGVVNVEKDEVVKEEKKSKDGETEIETLSGRPHRERKAVKRYSIASPSRGAGSSKPLAIAKGSGTPLKDIPNVAFKLSKKKPDDNLQLLHTILFGKKAKVHTLKRDIGQFSGFVWVDNEEKHQAKIKEKLDKCVKEKLLDFCDVLNIPVNKSHVRKEDLSVKLLEFLKSPHATTEELLADKEQKTKKQKGKGTPARNKSSKESSAEKSEKTPVGEKRKRSKSKKENEAVASNDVLDGQSHSLEEDKEAEEKEDSVQKEIKSDEEKDGDKEKKTSSKGVSKGNSGSKTGKKITNNGEMTIEESTKSPAKSVKKATGTKRSKSVVEASASSKGSSGEKLEKTQLGEKQKRSTKPKKVSEAVIGDDELDRRTHSSEEDEEAEKKKESVQEEIKSDEEKDEINEKKTSSKSALKGNSRAKIGRKTTYNDENAPEKSSKSPAESIEKGTGTKRSKSVSEAYVSSSKVKGSSNKRQKVNEESPKGKPVKTQDKPTKKPASKSASKSASGKGKTGKETKAEPTNDELRAEATKILNEVDFNTATLSDILQLLGTHFGLDLMHRKGEVKAIITEIIANMSDDDFDSDSDDGSEEEH